MNQSRTPTLFQLAGIMMIVSLVGIRESAPSSGVRLTYDWRKQPVNGETAKAMLQALRDPDREVREKGWGAILEGRDPAWIPHLKNWTEVDSPAVRERAIAVLGRMEGEESLKALLDVAGSTPHQPIRIAAISALSRFPDARIIPAMTLAVREFEIMNPHTAREALEALATLPEVEASLALAAMLSSPNPDLRWQAAYGLGARLETGGWTALKDALAANPFPEIRQQAIISLVRWGDPRAKGAVEERLQDADEGVRIQAAGGLKDEAGPGLEGSPFKSRENKEGRNALIARWLGLRTPEDFLMKVGRGEIPDRLQAILALSALDYSDDAVRAKVVKTLKGLRERKTERRIPEPEAVREAARQTIEMIEWRYQPHRPRRPAFIPPKRQVPVIQGR